MPDMRADTRSPDLFDRLVARDAAPASLPLARPRLAMPFERLRPAPLTELDVEVEAEAKPPTTPGRRSARPDSPALAAVQPSVLRQIEQTVRSVETVRSLPSAPERAAAPGVIRAVTERLVAPDVQVTPVTARPEAAAEPVAFPATGAPVPQPVPGTAAPAPTSRGQVVVPAMARTAVEARRREAAAAAAPAEPSVQVSIGRLEVTTAAPEPSRKREGRAGRAEPKVGLDEFLNRHSLNRDRREAM